MLCKGVFWESQSVVEQDNLFISGIPVMLGKCHPFYFMKVGKGDEN